MVFSLSLSAIAGCFFRTVYKNRDEREKHAFVYSTDLAGSFGEIALTKNV